MDDLAPIKLQFSATFTLRFLLRPWRGAEGRSRPVGVRSKSWSALQSHGCRSGSWLQPFLSSCTRAGRCRLVIWWQSTAASRLSHGPMTPGKMVNCQRARQRRGWSSCDIDLDETLDFDCCLPQLDQYHGYRLASQSSTRSMLLHPVPCHSHDISPPAATAKDRSAPQRALSTPHYALPRASSAVTPPRSASVRSNERCPPWKPGCRIALA